MSDDECDLDALIDVLDEEDELTDGPADQHGAEEAEDAGSATLDNEDGGKDDEDEEAMQRQLREMEEKMRKMKEKLKNKSSNKATPSKQEKSTTSQQNQNSPKTPSSQKSTVFNPSQKSPQTPSSQKPKLSQMKDVDLFSSPGTNDTGCRTLRSPVKTQPLKECEREKRPAIYEPRATEWCPSFIRKDSSRTLQGEEAEKLRAELEMKDRKRMEEVARRDLMDSSDEERDEDGNPLLNEYGREMKKRIARSQTNQPFGASSSSSAEAVDRIKGIGVSTGFKDKPGNKIALGKAESKKSGNILHEKHSGLRISRPLITQNQLEDAMKNRKMIQMSKLLESIFRKETECDWVTIGIVYYKAPAKTSANGNEFSIWKLTDLKGEIKTTSLFLFGRAHKSLWKTPLNKVVGILNPKVLENRNDGKSKGEVSISIDDPDKLMEMGDSYDIAKCAFVRPDGGNCTNIVNKGVCEFCVYHVKKAYKSSSARPALQSTFSGLGSDSSRERIMQKLAPWNKGEVFAGGQIMNPRGPVGKKSVKEKAKDAALLAGLDSGPGKLSQMLNSSTKTSKSQMVYNTSMLSSREKEAVKKVAEVSEDLGKRLLAPTVGARTVLASLVKEQEVKAKTSLPSKSAKDLLKEHTKAVSRGEKPKLGRGLSNSGDVFIDLSPSVKSNYSASHARALAILSAKKKKIEAAPDPNSAHKSKLKNKTQETQEKVKKRLAETLLDDDDPENDKNQPNKKLKVDNPPRTVTVFGKEMTVEELEKLKSRKSKNEHLAEEADLAAADKYFDVMEKKDEMEEKMLSTFEMKTKAVTCHTCNYTSFKASDLCKNEGHRYKVIDAFKRFYKCKDCKKRTVCLTKYPQETCKQCGGSSWLRAGMIAERKGPKLIQETLSVRGNEEKWLGGAVDANIHF